MSHLHVASIVAGLLAACSLGIYIGCQVRGDRAEIGRLAIGFCVIAFCAAAVFWLL
jgi:hypothetical protein